MLLNTILEEFSEVGVPCKLLSSCPLNICDGAPFGPWGFQGLDPKWSLVRPSGDAHHQCGLWGSQHVGQWSWRSGCSLRSWVRLSGYTQKSPTYIHSFSISFHFQPVSSHNSMNQIASLYNLYNFICTFSSWHIPLPFWRHRVWHQGHTYMALTATSHGFDPIPVAANFWILNLSSFSFIFRIFLNKSSLALFPAFPWIAAGVSSFCCHPPRNWMRIL